MVVNSTAVLSGIGTPSRAQHWHSDPPPRALSQLIFSTLLKLSSMEAFTRAAHSKICAAFSDLPVCPFTSSQYGLQKMSNLPAAFCWKWPGTIPLRSTAVSLHIHSTSSIQGYWFKDWTLLRMKTVWCWICIWVSGVHWNSLLLESLHNDFYSSVQQRTGHYMLHC